ncbi:hypothetical protein [Streptomyces rubiginosohelvolus]|uniref:Uncharacterized protein n=1 Tax=Streptomyces rubiginosohelvolus TaxID=67362 RepID=A0ABQ3CHH7_9ACTN|nr:hypothetical protein [Streptomyces pluricolorescens]GGZ83901.1 hypothetical protein GCM10010328_67550 [Streptomyces pluricolorescens]
MTTTSPEPMDDDADEEFDFVGDITDYWTHTQVRDWVLLLPEITRTALHLYLTLRSMVYEAARRKRQGDLRRMSLDQLCFLLPGVKGKPCSPTMIKDALKLLDELNLVVNPEGGRLVKSTGKGGLQNSFRTYKVNDMPPDAFVGWRNVWDKLDAYTVDWRENPPQPPLHTRRGDEVVQTAAGRPAPAAAAQEPEEPKGDAPAKQAPAAKKAAAKKTAPKKTAPKKTAPPKGDQEDGGEVPVDTSAAKPVVDAWTEGMKAGGRPFLPKRAKLIEVEAAELLEAGADLDHLCRVAEWMGRHKPSWKVLEDAMTFPEAPQPVVPGQRSNAPRPEMCGHHPAFPADDCPQCRLAERERQQRSGSEPAAVDGVGLLERLRAGQPA